MGSASFWHQTLESTLAELERLHFEENLPKEQAHYAKVLTTYLKGDLPALEKLCSQASDWSIPLCQARLALRKRAPSSAVFQALEQAQFPQDLPELDGERMLLQAQLMEVQEDWDASIRLYKQAGDRFESCGLVRRALRARFNAVACSTHTRPHDKRLFRDYQTLFEEARKAREFGFAGLSLQNMSKEYAHIGATKVALRFANRALVFLKRDFGSLNYYRGLLHRADLLRALGRTSEFETDLEECLASPFPEILEARARMLGEKPSTENYVTPRWKSPTNAAPRSALGERENQLLELLSQNPRTRIELVQKMYGDSVPVDQALNRLDVLLSRIRKKIPGEIVLQDGLYRWVDPVETRGRKKTG